MDKEIPQLTFEDFCESLFKTIMGELDHKGIALISVNDRPVGLFKAPDEVANFKNPNTIN